MVAVIVCLLATTLPPGTAPAAGAPVEKIELRGQAMPVWPAADLQARGFAVQDLPREKNAAWVYLEACNSYEDLPPDLEAAFNYAVSSVYPVGVAGLDEYLQRPRNRAALALTQRASTMPQCQMPYFGEPGQSVLALILPNLSMLRFLSKLVVVEGQRLEAKGDHDAAVEQYLTCARMGTHAGAGITLIENLVGFAICNLAQQRLADLVLRHDLSPAQLERLDRALVELGPRLPSSERGLRQERIAGLQLVDELCSRPLRVLSGVQEMSVDGGPADVNVVPADGWGRLEQRVGRLLLPDRTIKQHMTAYYDRVLEFATQPPGQRSLTEADVDAVVQRIPAWDVIARMSLPSLTAAAGQSWRAQAQWNLLRGLVALRSYMARHAGTPPARLADLGDALSADALLDVYSGQPLRYRVESAGWVLYSVGPNGRDDGGVAALGWQDMDMVWRYPPAPVEPFVPAPTEPGT
ncbi:MAG TPA: hypothetical protein PKK06_09905 [Phycisphaerae bacterium]|nr:hypothetical protein [Phycisphaerae bacterium]HNU45660.1 hypothetical protein [Phycisphaerae bacterium]